MSRKLVVGVPDLTEGDKKQIIEAADRNGFEVEFCTMQEEALPADGEIVFSGSPAFAKNTEKLRWQCSVSAGVNQFKGLPVFENGTALLSNSSGAYGVTIAEHLVMMTLEMLRRQVEFAAAAARKEWHKPLPVKSVYGSRITFAGTGDIAEIMVKAGLGAAGLLIIVFSTVTTTFLDAYSAGVSAASMSPKLPEKTVAIVVAIVGTIGAIVYPMDNITDFLYLIGSVFAPMIAIQIADYFLLKKSPVREAVSWKNLALWLVGFLCYRALMRVDTPVGNTLPDMLITAALCIVVNLVVSHTGSRPE
jgi:hypothetical protein